MRVILAAGFAERGYQVDLILIGGALPEYEREALPENVRVIELGKYRVAVALPSLISYLRETRPTAIVAAEEHLNVLAIAALIISGVPSVISVSFHVPPERSGFSPLWRKERWNFVLGHWLLPRADAIIAISSGMADALAKTARLPRNSIRVIHNPVVRDALFEMAAQDAKPTNIGGGLQFVLSVGRLSPNKGFADLIEAFSLVQSERNLNLVILGEGGDRANLEKQVRDLGLENRVFLPGAVENPFAWMAKAKLFVLASYFEGLSNVLVEAMACGCPVVSTDCLTGPREILQDGRYGSLVAMRDPHALASAMQETLDNPLDSEFLTQRSMDFHVDVIIEQYLEALALKA
jgi:glycosyltransferase involved in cell wall biosynthesis